MIILVIALVFGLIGGVWANTKNRSAIGWGLVCFLFPVVGLVILAFQKPLASPYASGSPQISQSRLPESRGPDMGRWQALVEVDAEIGAAAARARAAGLQYEQMLAEKYLVLNDKQYLSAALAKVLEQARTDAREQGGASA